MFARARLSSANALRGGVFVNAEHGVGVAHVDDEKHGFNPMASLTSVDRFTALYRRVAEQIARKSNIGDSGDDLAASSMRTRAARKSRSPFESATVAAGPPGASNWASCDQDACSTAASIRRGECASTSDPQRSRFVGPDPRSLLIHVDPHAGITYLIRSARGQFTTNMPRTPASRQHIVWPANVGRANRSVWRSPPYGESGDQR